MTRDPVAFGNFRPGFLSDLGLRLAGKRVLEVFAGNGFFASLLAAQGVMITATSRFTGHDGHEEGLLFPVIEMDAVQAVHHFGKDADVLLMSWPTVTEAVLRSVKVWGPDKNVIFIGEWTDYAKNHLGGCATDEFFESVEILEDIPSYQSRNIMERAVVVRLSGWSRRLTSLMQATV
jgi:hypothetical protein